MKLSWIGFLANWFTKNRKADGLVLLPEVLIAMMVVAFCMAQLWQTVFGSLNFGNKIEQEILWQERFGQTCVKVSNSPSAMRQLLEKKVELKVEDEKNKQDQLVIKIEKINPKSDLYKIAGERFVYLVVTNSKKQSLKIPIFLGKAEDQKEGGKSSAKGTSAYKSGEG